MKRKLGSRHAKDAVDDSGVAAEAQAFLDGRYREVLAAGSDTPPAWTHLNVLAHGTPAELDEVASGQWWSRQRGPCCPRWRTALAFLATEIFESSAGDPAALRRLQRRVLIPLEVALSEAPATETDLSPADLTTRVLTALRGRQDRNQDQHH